MQPRLRWPLLAIVVALAPASARQVTTQTATIEGRVVDAVTARPIGGAVVRANLAREAAFRTGQDGRFAFRLAAGTIALQATKAGYISAGAEPAEIAPGARRSDVVVRLTPAGMISGRVVDRSGIPVERVTVLALPRAEADRPGSATSAVTDDLGNYMIGGLAPGEFIVRVESAMTGLQVQTNYSPLYFPAAASPDDATTIHITAGWEQRGIDFQLAFQPFTMPTPSHFVTDGPTAGTIAGVVRDSLGRPLVRASVMLMASDLFVLGGSGLRIDAHSTFTDEQGRFHFANLAPRRLTLQASRSECLSAGGVMSHRTPIQLEPGQRLVDLSITLPDAGMLTGTLTDEFGDPLDGAVFLSERSSWSTGPPARADPRGRFRFGCLAPGEYLLSVDQGPSRGDLQTWTGSGAEQTVAILPVYFPGVTDPSLAAPVLVRAGADSGGFTMVVRPAPVTTIDVTIDAPGREISNSRLVRLPIDDGWGATVWNSTDGRRFGSVPAGRFLLVASGEEAQGSTPSRLWSTQEITSNGTTPLSVTLVLQTGGRISGRIVFEGRARRPADLGALLVPIGTGSMRALGGTQRNATIDQGEFSIADVLPGQYLLRVTEIYPSSLWMLRSITMDGQNILDRPVDITAGADLANVVVTFTDQITEISGTVADTAGRPVPLEAVVVFPADARHWRQPSLLTFVASTDASGRYRISGVPPGDYRVAASENAERSALPSLLPKLLPTAVSVAMSPGDRKVVNLTR